MGEAAAKEPSMEDILASIRKIIADEGASSEDQTETPPPEDTSGNVRFEAAKETPTATEPARTIASEATFEEQPATPAPDNSPSGEEAAAMAGSLASIAAAVTGNARPEHQQEPVPDVSAASANADPGTGPEPTQRIEMADATPAPKPPVPVAAEDSHADDAVSQDEEAFRGALMSPSVDNAVTGSFERLKRSALDDMDAKTEAILRPLLRDWLDENLPTLVERLVREEIERVARGT